MNSWLELETRFRNLSGPLRFYRLDIQWGACGENWMIGGGPPNSVVQEFEVLASLAGNALGNVRPDIGPRGIDPKTRWYWALKELSGGFRQGIVGYQTDVAGNNVGNVYTGSVQDIARSSVNLCLKLELECPLKQEIPASVDKENRVLNLKPGAFGVNINLHALFNKFSNWRNGPKR